MESTNIALDHLMIFKDTATEKLAKIEHLEGSLHDVAVHVRSVDNTLKEMKDTAKDLIGIVAGKRQVPLTIFIVVVSMLCSIILIEKLGEHKAEVNLSPTEFKYKPTYEPK